MGGAVHIEGVQQKWHCTFGNGALESRCSTVVVNVVIIVGGGGGGSVIV